VTSHWSQRVTGRQPSTPVASVSLPLDRARQVASEYEERERKKNALCSWLSDSSDAKIRKQ
jgi:hypothetical protein